MNTVLDQIKISRIKAFGFHGALAQEQALGQWFYVSLELDMSFAACVPADDLSKATNYADVIARVVEIVGTRPPFSLIETLAEKIAHDLLESFPRVQKISVEVHKPSAPVSADCADISVKIVRTAR